MIIVDLETSASMFGVSNASILSIGALEFENPSNEFYGECRVDDGAEVDPESLAIGGFTQEEIMDASKKSVQELLTDFFTWAESVKEKTFGGQAPMNDVNMLMKSTEKHGIKFPLGYRTVDLHAICYVHALKHGKQIPLEEHTASDFGLDNILAYVGLKSRPGAHNALDDTKLTAEALSRLINGVSLLPEYSEFAIPEVVLTK